MSPQLPNSTAAQDLLPKGFMPLGGLNATDNYASVEASEVSGSANFLFDSGLAYTRPGVTAAPFADVANPVVFGDNIAISGTLHNILIDSANNIFDEGGIGIITPATGAAVFGSAQYNNACSCDGTLLMGNNPAGLINWAPPATTYSLIPGAAYRYVANHYGRAIAAYQILGGSVLTNARTFAWSTPGNVASWTSADGSAGNLAIAECEDSISGLGVLHNIAVILRTYGIHLGYPTGTLPLPYDVQTFTRRGAGCLYPPTVGWSDETAFFVGEDDVYRFDLQSVQPIGYKIRALLIPQLLGGVTYRGFVTRSVHNTKPRLRYHLYPVGNPNSPHFSYDILADNWGVHYYAADGNWAWNYQVSNVNYGFAFVSSAASPTIQYWDANQPCERQPFIQKYVGVAENPDTDYTVVDIIIKNLDYGVASLTIEIAATIGTTVTTKSALIAALGATNSGQFVRNWLSRSANNIQIAGNEFLVTLSPQIGTNFAMNYYSMRLSNASEYRG